MDPTVLIDWIPFLSAYPQWVRVFAIIWLAAGMSVFIFTPRKESISDQLPKTVQLQQSQNINQGSTGHQQNAQTINNYFQNQTSDAGPLTPEQEQLLRLIAEYQSQFATNKLIVDRIEGRFYFDDSAERGKDIDLIRELYGMHDQLSQIKFVQLMESMPPEYLRTFPENRYDNPFIVGITPAGQKYLRGQVSTKMFWQELTEEELSNLYRTLQTQPSHSIFIAYNNNECASLANSFSTLFQRLKWPYEVGDAGVLSIGAQGVIINPNDKIAAVLENAIKKDTRLPVSLSLIQRQANDVNPIMLIIGTKPQ